VLHEAGLTDQTIEDLLSSGAARAAP